MCIARPPCLQQCNFLCAEMDLKTLLEKYSAFFFFVTTFDVECISKSKRYFPKRSVLVTDEKGFTSHNGDFQSLMRSMTFHTVNVGFKRVLSVIILISSVTDVANDIQIR